jgi:hypothetical protein
MPNYVKAAATAKRLVDGAGRDVTLVQLDFDTPDPAKPWRGRSNPRETPASTVTLKAAFLPLAGNVQLGISQATIDLAKKNDETCMIGTTLDLSIYQELVDSLEGRRYKIVGTEVLAPGGSRLLTFLVLKQ